MAYTYDALLVGFTPASNEWDVDNAKDALDDLYLRTSSYLVSFSVSDNKSEIFSNISFTVDQYRTDLVVNVTPTFKTGYSSSDIYEYILVANDKLVSTSKTTTITFANINAGQRYVLRVIVLDKDSKMHKSGTVPYDVVNTFTKVVLSRPIITDKGAMTVRYDSYPDTAKTYYDFDETVDFSNTDGLPVGAYDGDMTTYAGPYNVTYKYLDIDPSAYGKTMKIYTSGNYSCYYFPSSQCGRSTNYTFTVPSTTEFKVYGNESHKFYEIVIE